MGGQMSDTPREQAASDCEAAALELESAARHLRTAAGHFRDHEVPRACAHLLAAQGHMAMAEDGIRERARVHARKSVP